MSTSKIFFKKCLALTRINNHCSVDQNRSHDIFPTLGASAAVAIQQKSSSVINIYVDCRLDFSVKPDVTNPMRCNQIIVKNLYFTTLVMKYLHYNRGKKALSVYKTTQM